MLVGRQPFVLLCSMGCLSCGETVGTVGGRLRRPMVGLDIGGGSQRRPMEGLRGGGRFFILWQSRAQIELV